MMMMVVARVLNRIGGLVLQSPRELHDGIFRGGHPRVGKGLSRGGSHRKTLCHYIITYPKIAILGSKSVNHSALPIIVPSSFANKQRKGGGGEGKFGNSIFQRSKNLVIFIKLYRNIDGRIATFL